MGLIEKAIGKALDAVPLNKAVGQIPIFKTIKWTYKAAKAGYAVGTAFDNYTGASDKLSKLGVDKIGPASKGLINAVDKGEQLYNKGKGLYDKGKGFYDKVVNKAKSITGTGPTKTLTQNPAGSKIQASNVTAALQPKNPTISSPSNKTKTTSSIKLPKHRKLKPVKLGTSLPYNSFKSATKLNALSSPNKPKFNPATSKAFTIKTKAGVSKFDPAKSKMFKIKPQATKFNPIKSKIFTIKPKPSAFKINQAKTNAFTPKSKASFTLKPNTTKSAFPSKISKSPFPKNAFKPSYNRSSPISRPVKIGPFKR
jgi:hypothetical protein